MSTAEASGSQRLGRERPLILTAAVLAALVLALSFALFFAGRDWLHLRPAHRRGPGW